MKRKENQGLSPGSFQQFKKKKNLSYKENPIQEIEKEEPVK